jgi:hypothetical protein
MRVRSIGGAVAAAVLGLVGTASAEPTADQKATAAQLAEDSDVFTSIDTPGKTLYATLNKKISGNIHIVLQ